ncbi:MAG: hypothetical protein NZM42_13380 [Gemmatales bacterium]|nr:hypothetical protein [Gemmatales bacterium]MDW8223822.1 hypothetical protein [Gemmatales bacterium]
MRWAVVVLLGIAVSVVLYGCGGNTKSPNVSNTSATTGAANTKPHIPGEAGAGPKKPEK